PLAAGQPLRLALLLALPVIGVEQLVHTDRPTLAALPLYQALHWLSDTLLALPLAAVAVWGGQRLATRLRLGERTPPAIVGRACLIALLFALVLVPGTALHDAADRLTHVHVLFPTHSQVPLPSPAAPAGDPTGGLLFNASRVFASVQTPQTPLPGGGVRQFVEALPTFVGRRVDDSFIEVGMVAFQQATLPDRLYAGLPAPFNAGTYVWGYQVGDDTRPSWPGTTIEAQRGRATTIKYVNSLPLNPVLRT